MIAIKKRSLRRISEPSLLQAVGNADMMALLLSVGKAVLHDGLVPSRRGLSFVEAVRAVVRDLARGEVVSYGEVARRAGYPRAARAVGNVLASSHSLPWWRVVRANGELAAHAWQEQARRLQREGVAVRNGIVKARPIRKTV